MPEMKLLEAVRLSLDELLEADSDVLLLGHDIGVKGGVFQATRGLFEKYGPDRVIDFPLSTAVLVGSAVGMALYGLKPICEIQFGGFIHPAFNQIVNEAARIHYRSCGEWQVPLVIRAPYGGGVGGGLYHSQSIEAFFAHVPGLKVVVPSNPYDARGLLKCAVADPNPVLFLEPIKGYRLMEGDVPQGSYTIPLGSARVTRPGSHLSVFSYGLMHHYCLSAAEKLSREGVDVEVVDLRTLRPLDRETVFKSVKKTNRALIVYEDNLTGGYGAEVAALIAEYTFVELDAPVRRLAGPDVPAVPFSYPMQEWFMPNPEKIAAAMRDLAAY
jgi:2-oxoisovalerate dehydrogenase E1 component beta subunit